ncbi:2-hydroxyacyl-CoA dehydratase [Halonatronum saccharophilum]|uniref:2-hydroxyacyl-CoA dehydratase n=1 Tax=Halonatronum saccharophilum TaxID=150060 RepID=UPI0004820F8E|nr:2-hydroxyacyl-CoA dehydratase [Halonatronum saccharophilum]
MGRHLNLGLDVGSTTVKIVILDVDSNVIYKEYKRHFSEVRKVVIEMLKEVRFILEKSDFTISITGSGGMDIADLLEVPFLQEVVACSNAIEKFIPSADVAIELGGEDAKITYFGDSVEQRMNAACAGGTGAFIDQMSSLLESNIEGLNDLAKEGENIYSIASRCGVFAKSDVQSLLNDGASKEDIALSILQAVVNQTIGGLAQGRPIRGKVALLGGPLHFIPELRERFKLTLDLKDDDILKPEDGQFFVALGAALESKEEAVYSSNRLYERLALLSNIKIDNTKSLDPLFIDEDGYKNFKERHNQYKVARDDISNYSGSAYLGIDAGSTTTKMALISEEGKLLYSYYGSNKGDPLNTVIEALKEIYPKLNQDIEIANSAVTGYGEDLIKAALNIDIGEVETVAHYKAASFFLPEVDFILDIGGQDMKSLEVKDGVIDSIMLNEACSSGCGSFIETFAKSLDYDIEEFAQLGIKANSPIDLGTRCTVFMNSKVKEAQKEGANVEDISAGLAVSVIKNALFKVIGYNSNEDLAKNIVVQGGTFYNDGVLRALEQITGQNVVRPDIAGIMGAFGSALIAKERSSEKGKSKVLGLKELEGFKVSNSQARCNKCGNNCLLTIKKFSNNSRFISGNRCEKGIGVDSKNHIPNIYDYKHKRVFDYQPLEKDEANRGIIGIPRVLNMYEDYPFWFTLFNNLGYRVILSSPSSKETYQKGIETIPSESICYPAKLVHGHIMELIKDKGVRKIFYPSIPYNIKEDEKANNNFNCPVVTSYPETIRANLEELQDKEVKFYHPFLPLHNKKKLVKRLSQELREEGLTKRKITKAVESAYEALDKYKEDIKVKGEEVLNYIDREGKLAIVLAGRPYHIDPEVNHGIAQLIQSLGCAVITEDAISHLAKPERPLRVVDQWVYHSRLYSAATYVGRRDDLELVQLTSFGCGLDAVTTDQVEEILKKEGKLYTLLKIDEVSNLGAAKIRVRSLLAAIKERQAKTYKEEKLPSKERVLFTEERKKRDTILAPQMSPIHFELLESAFQREGYNLEVLPSVDKEAIDVGLRYVNNDACYPSIIVIGQLMEALLSGKYDLDRTSVIISQTGGGCRATNYIAFLRKALKEAGLENIPVISLNSLGLEKNPGFKLTLSLVDNLFRAVAYGDLLMKVLYKTRPYEKLKGSADKLYKEWMKKCQESLLKGEKKEFKNNIKDIIRDFDNLELKEGLVKPKVGIVGEILVKFHPTANNNLIEFLEKEGAEVVVPSLLDFFLYSLYNSQEKYKKFANNWMMNLVSKIGIRGIEFRYRRVINKALEESQRFEPFKSIYDIAEGANKHLSLGHHTGEGWFLTGEMVELIDEGVKNILCLQPFGCLPNHVVGKGMVKELRDSYSGVNIKPIDYDPGASLVNQFNRIKLLLSVAFKNLEEMEEGKEFENEDIEIFDSPSRELNI